MGKIAKEGRLIDPRVAGFLADSLVWDNRGGLGLDYVFDHVELKAFLAAHPEMFPPEQGYSPGAEIRMVEPEQVPEIAEGLFKLGYVESDLRAILGENHLRVASRVWK